jgi:hypothetical protein
MNELIQSRTVPHGDVLQPDCLLLSDQLFDGGGFIGHTQTAKFIGHDAQRPNIAFFIISLLLVPHLRTGIERRTSLSLRQITIGHDLRNVHVGQLIDRLGSLEDVCRLDIAMDDVVLMQVL